MKLQINSLAALERLIGGDTEVEIEVRNISKIIGDRAIAII